MRINKLIKAFAVSTLALAGAAHAAVIDLGFGVDESSSVNSAEFALARDGLASALSQVPTSGDNTYRISVVYFTGSARTVVPVTAIDSAAALTGVINTISTTPRSFGGTNIASAVDLLTSNFVMAGLGDTSIFNISTDGVGGDVTGAASAAFAAGIDALSYEAVGSGASTASLLASAFPGTPVLIDDVADLPSDILSTSFVLTVDDFLDFEGAIRAKVGKVIVDTGGDPDPTDPGPNVVPLPAGLPLLLTGMLGLAGWSRRRKG